MKRLTALAITLILAFTLFGCAKSTTNPADTTEPVVTASQEASLTYKGDLDTLLFDYREEVKKRLIADESFGYPDSKGQYYKISVEFETSGTLGTLYTTEYGRIHIDAPEVTTNVLGSLHIDDIYMNVIESTLAWSLYYAEADSELILFQFGERVASIPVRGYYCGKSEQVGHLFRDAYVVDAYSINGLAIEKQTIAGGVEYVVDSDYKQSSDAWSVPLFQMEDGSLKAYVPWEEELQDPYLEGGYH